MPQLTKAQRNELWTAYESALSVDCNDSSRVGEHAILIQTMLEYGFIVGSVMDAYEICQEIFGW